MTQSNFLIKAENISKNFFFIKHNIVAKKSFRFKYIRYRILRPVLKSYYWIFKQFNPGRPWTSPASIRIFDQLLTKEMVGFEYGSGRSTVYFSRKIKELISVEHDQDWFKLVEQLLSQESIKNAQYKLLPESNNSATDEHNFNQAQDLPAEFVPRKTFEAYYNYINEYPNNHFDFVLIDGRARTECGLNAIPKLKHQGLLVLDNSERSRYDLLREKLQDWPKIYTTTGLTNTTIWVKP